jgi:hypothetical protein
LAKFQSCTHVPFQPLFQRPLLVHGEGTSFGLDVFCDDALFCRLKYLLLDITVMATSTFPMMTITATLAVALAPERGVPLQGRRFPIQFDLANKLNPLISGMLLILLLLLLRLTLKSRFDFRKELVSLEIIRFVSYVLNNNRSRRHNNNRNNVTIKPGEAFRKARSFPFPGMSLAFPLQN